MTGFLHEQAFSRRAFVKGGGALIVGFSMAGSALAGKASAAAAAEPGDFLPDPNQIDSWIQVNADNTAVLKTSQIEVGNGITTGYLQLVAEELDMDLSQLYYGQVSKIGQPVVDSYRIVSSGGEGGSFAMQGSATKPRAAAVAAKQALLGMASQKLGAPVSQLSVSKGIVSGGGKTVSYGELVGGKLFNVTMPASWNMAGGGFSGPPSGLQPGQAPAKPISSYQLVGTSPPRIDIPAKIAGTYTYIHNLRVPGMIHGRVVRPRGQGGVSSSDFVPLSVDANSISHIPNTKVVQLGNFLGVVAPREYDAIQAAAQLKVTWKSDPLLPGTGNYWKDSRAAADKLPAKYTTNMGDVEGALAKAAHTVSATYMYPFNGHLPIGPSCAIADVRPDGAVVFANPQNVEGLPGDLAGLSSGGKPLLGLKPDQIRAVFYEGASTFGDAPSTSFDAEEAAAIMSKLVGKPVRVQFMRWDEHGWDNYGPATMYDVKAGIDPNGNIVALDWVSYTQASAAVTPSTEAIGSNTWPSTPALGAAGTSDTIYKVSTTSKRVLAKSFPLYNGSLRSSYLRAPGAQQSHFAGEQLVDELAYAAKMDPLEFRRQNIDPGNPIGAQWLAVLDAAAKASNWQPKVAASNLGRGTIVSGRGFSFGTFTGTQVGMVADVQVNKKTGKITATHLTIVHDNGLTINPGLVANQMSGAAVQGLSRALWEEVTFSKERVTSLDWVGYPILRFKDTPTVTTIVLAPTGGVTVPAGANVSMVQANNAIVKAGWAMHGAGEPASVPPAAAVANAFFDATGVRIRQAPMTPPRVRAVLKQAGVV